MMNRTQRRFGYIRHPYHHVTFWLGRFVDVAGPWWWQDLFSKKNYNSFDCSTKIDHWRKRGRRRIQSMELTALFLEDF